VKKVTSIYFWFNCCCSGQQGRPNDAENHERRRTHPLLADSPSAS
jgi:hypothetical protein